VQAYQNGKALGPAGGWEVRHTNWIFGTTIPRTAAKKRVVVIAARGIPLDTLRYREGAIVIVSER
jgi:hypothetical protein